MICILATSLKVYNHVELFGDYSMTRSTSLLVMIAAAVAVAQRPGDLNQLIDVTRNEAFHRVPAIGSAVEAASPTATELRPQALNFSLLFQTPISAQFSYLWPSTSPIAYEPVSRVLAVVEQVATQTPSQDWNTQLVYRYSTNNGNTWLRQVLVNQQNIFLGMPQIALANPEGTTTPTALKILLSAYRYPRETGYYRQGTGLFARVDPTQTYEYEQPGPTDNNPDGYRFGAGKLVGYTAGTDRSGFAYCGVLSPPSDAVQYGQYGAFVANARLADLSDFIGQIPPTWSNSQFRAAPARTSTYNSPMYVDADANGNLYAVINALFADNQDNRVVAFSKSTDVGESWSTFERMPVSVLQAYAANRGAAAAVPFRVYDQHALVVTGENRFSYIQRIALFADQQTLAGIDLVETEYNNGNWTMRLIAPINDIVVGYTYNDSAMNARNYQQLVCDEVISPSGNEIEVARTADGANLVVKWVDAVPGATPIVINPPQTVLRYNQQTGEFVEEIQVDTLPVFNIFIATRSLSSQSWSDPINLTNDRSFFKGTHIPMVVPSVDNIPLMALRSLTSWNTQTNVGRLLSQTPQEFVSRIFNLPHEVVFARTSAVLSAEPQPRMSNVNLAVSPMPATDVIEIAYGMTATGGEVAVINALGQTVLTKPLTPSDGVHGMRLDVHTLPAGAYNVLLRTPSGISATAPLIIVR